MYGRIQWIHLVLFCVVCPAHAEDLFVLVEVLDVVEVVEGFCV
jgi:hypothetical protein